MTHTTTLPAEITDTFAMARGGETYTAASLTELVAELIAGYLDMSDDEATLARYATTALTVSELQQLAAAQAVAEGTFSPDTAGEAMLTAIFAPRTTTVMPGAVLVPSPLDLNALGLDLAWGAAVPLFLTATDYAPYTDLPRPTGNVFWIDPGTERSFLISLAQAGVIEFYVKSSGSDDL